MIYGCLNEVDQWAFLKADPVWHEAFDWLRSLAEEPAVGRYPLRGEEMFGLVMRYSTVIAEESRFESHRRFVDLQYTISGGEKIAWSRSANLTPDGEYEEEKDVQFYMFKHSESIVHKTAGRFSVYYPTDAHLPKIADGTHSEVFKAVVKIGRHILKH